VERSASVTINASPGPDSVLLTFITTNAGLPTLKSDGSTALDVALEAMPFIDAPASYSWDFNGDGTGELLCSASPAASGRFTTPGIYLPTVTVTDSSGKTYKDTSIINVMNKDDMDGIFKMIWKGMKNSLSNQDITRAMTYFTDSSKNSFTSQFAAVGSALSTAVANIGDVNRVKIEEDFSEYEFKTQRNGDTYSFQVIFNRDTDGMWRIFSF
jgi:PKD repeat protein